MTVKYFNENKRTPVLSAFRWHVVALVTQEQHVDICAGTAGTSPELFAWLVRCCQLASIWPNLNLDQKTKVALLIAGTFSQ